MAGESPAVSLAPLKFWWYSTLQRHGQPPSDKKVESWYIRYGQKTWPGTPPSVETVLAAAKSYCLQHTKTNRKWSGVAQPAPTAARSRGTGKSTRTSMAATCQPSSVGEPLGSSSQQQEGASHSMPRLAMQDGMLRSMLPRGQSVSFSASTAASRLGVPPPRQGARSAGYPLEGQASGASECDAPSSRQLCRDQCVVSTVGGGGGACGTARLGPCRQKRLRSSEHQPPCVYAGPRKPAAAEFMQPALRSVHSFSNLHAPAEGAVAQRLAQAHSHALVHSLAPTWSGGQDMYGASWQQRAPPRPHAPQLAFQGKPPWTVTTPLPHSCEDVHASRDAHAGVHTWGCNQPQMHPQQGRDMHGTRSLPRLVQSGWLGGDCTQCSHACAPSPPKPLAPSRSAPTARRQESLHLHGTAQLRLAPPQQQQWHTSLQEPWSWLDDDAELAHGVVDAGCPNAAPPCSEPIAGSDYGAFCSAAAAAAAVAASSTIDSSSLDASAAWFPWPAAMRGASSMPAEATVEPSESLQEPKQASTGAHFGAEVLEDFDFGSWLDSTESREVDVASLQEANAAFASLTSAFPPHTAKQQVESLWHQDECDQTSSKQHIGLRDSPSDLSAVLKTASPHHMALQDQLGSPSDLSMLMPMASSQPALPGCPDEDNDLLEPLLELLS